MSFSILKSWQMIKFWTLTIALFLIGLFIFWKLTNVRMRKEYGEKMFKQWTSQLYFWQGAIYSSAAITILIMYILKQTNVLTY